MSLEPNLTDLAMKYGSDKAGAHQYTQHYERYFTPVRKAPLNILEIGVGGYDAKDKGGASLYMWRDYFPCASIYGIDIYDKSGLEGERIKIFRGDQADEDFLNHVGNTIGPIDIIIDDGSHVNRHVIKTFKTLFQHLRARGIYAVEDVQTSYWPEQGGNSFSLSNPATIMGYFKSLTDGLNYQELDNPFYEATALDKSITNISFYHNLIFITKGDNNEGSNAGCTDVDRVRANRRSFSYQLRRLQSYIWR